MQRIVLNLGLLMISAAILAPTSALAEDLYVPTFHVITTEGTYQKNVIAGGEKGVSWTECQMRTDAWEAEFGPGFKVIIAQMEKEGLHPSYRVSCERK